MDTLFSIRQAGAVRAHAGMHFGVGLVIPVWNRPAYLARTLASLRASALDDVIVVLADDASDAPRTLTLLKHHGLPDLPVLCISRRRRAGLKIHENLRHSWDYLAEEYSCDYLAVLDSDMQVRPHWLAKLRAAHEAAAQKYPRLLLTGFNAPQHPVLHYDDTYCLKESIGGGCVFFDRALYRGLVRPCLVPAHAGLHWDWSLVQLCRSMNIPLLSTCPSVVQHIGRRGIWSRGWRYYDWAPDYHWGRTFAVVVYPLLHFFFNACTKLRRRLRGKIASGSR